MKFSADKKSLAEVLSRVQGITSRRTNLAITSDVLIKASGSLVTVTANDLETVFQGIYEAEVESDGIISINSKKLHEIVREYPDSMVPINEVENRWVEIGKDKVVFHIVSSDYENFPETPVIEDIPFVTVDSADFKSMVEVVASIGFSPDEKRLYVLGALFEKIDQENQNKIRMVSTDSRRLHCFDIPFNGELHLPEENVLIPKKSLSELSKFLEHQGEVNIGIKDNHFIVKNTNETVMIKLLEGEYPDYRRVINTQEMVPIEMERNLFLMVMRRMSILASDDYKSVLFNFKKDELIVTITNPEIGESKEEIGIGYNGEKFESAFNPRYFIDALNAFKEDTITLFVKDNKNPCIIKGLNNEKLVCAIMAMTV